VALRKAQSATEVAAPLVWLGEVAATVSPGYAPIGLPAYAAELATLARQLGMTVATDWGERPCVSWDDAGWLYRHLTQPQPAPVDSPRQRGHIPGGTTFADPSVPKAEVH
jgi:hypothetical protein